MGALRLLQAGAMPERHDGEVYGCAYAPNGDFVLSAGWDGMLRLHDAQTGMAVASIKAGPKPLSCCCFAPDGRQWLSGSMEGLFAVTDGVSFQSLLNFVAHTRPISSIIFSPDGQQLATTSWDKTISVRKVGKEREGRTLNGHADIVAGARFTLDGKSLISWSYDGTIKVWDLKLYREVSSFTGHSDRVLAAALSPDGRWLLSGGMDGMARLWDVESKDEIAAINVGADVRCCFVLPDAETATIIDAVGRVFLFALPSFQVQAQLPTSLKVMTGDVSPCGTQIALGGEDGGVHFVAIEGYEHASLVVAAVSRVKERATILDRMLGQKRMARLFEWTCPACRQAVEATSPPASLVSCPGCQRQLRVVVSGW